MNLDKFSEVVLDFRDVQSVGQGFADEVFRVFARRYPTIVLKTENANSVIDAMIRHVSSSRFGTNFSRSYKSRRYGYAPLLSDRGRCNVMWLTIEA